METYWKKKTTVTGKALGEALKELKLIWANSNFEISADDLLEKHLPKVLEDIELKGFTNKKL